MGGSSDYGLSPDEVLARESLLSYFVELLKRLGPVKIDGPELKRCLQERLEDPDSLLMSGRGKAESLTHKDNFISFLSRSFELFLVDDVVCVKKDEHNAKALALTEILNSVPPVMTTAPPPIEKQQPLLPAATSTSNNVFGAIGSSSPTPTSSLPATNVWKSGPPSIIGKQQWVIMCIGEDPLDIVRPTLQSNMLIIALNFVS